jgi:hypothetical protein
MANDKLDGENLNLKVFFNWTPVERLHTMMSPTIIKKYLYICGLEEFWK